MIPIVRIILDTMMATCATVEEFASNVKLIYSKQTK
jgi:hypothetical protein